MTDERGVSGTNRQQPPEHLRPAASRLTTARLTLRQFEPRDFPAYRELCADAAVMRHLGGPLSDEDAWRQMAYFLGHWSLRGYGMYAVEDRGTGELVGRVGYLHPEGWPGFEVGWTLRRSSWGRGFATEAATAAIDQAFDTMGADRVISLIAPDNESSIAVARRLGETVTGEAVVRGARVLVFGVEREDWNPA
jgi:RimJ/RimL family protein N-acetyltransferase